MLQPRVTIAITVHNREQYIRQCLDSVLAQTVHDIDVICVDDASTDGSYDILRQYAAVDNRIRLYRFPENRGVQLARNHAIMTARGEYIIFVDDDDWLSVDCVENCLRCFNQNSDVDCVLIPEIRQRPDGTQYKPVPRVWFDKITGEEAFLLSIPWRVAGNFCVRISFQRQHLYDNSCRYFGDENTGRLMLLSSRYVVLSDGWYYYRMTESSVCHSVGIGHYSRLHSQRVLADRLKEQNIAPRLRSAYETFCWMNVIGAYMRYYKERRMMDKATCNEALEIIRQVRQQIDFTMVDKGLIRKFGYMPFCCSWTIFRIQEELYFFIRTLLGRMSMDDTGDPDR